MKYAKINNNVVELISYQPVNGWEQVSDDVYAEMTKKSDGTFDYTDEVKQKNLEVEQELQDAETRKASGKQKLIDLGLTTEEIKALTGV